MIDWLKQNNHLKTSAIQSQHQKKKKKKKKIKTSANEIIQSFGSKQVIPF
jgi:hypothetical protein